MNVTQTETRYYIFRCRNRECNETIPVMSFISQYTYTAGGAYLTYLKGRAVERDCDLIAVDVICPFCCSANHLRIMENNRELSRHDYEEETKAMRIKLALSHELDKVLAQDHESQPGAVSTIP